MPRKKREEDEDVAVRDEDEGESDDDEDEDGDSGEWEYVDEDEEEDDDYEYEYEDDDEDDEDEEEGDDGEEEDEYEDDDEEYDDEDEDEEEDEELEAKRDLKNIFPRNRQDPRFHPKSKFLPGLNHARSPYDFGRGSALKTDHETDENGMDWEDMERAIRAGEYVPTRSDSWPAQMLYRMLKQRKEL